MPKSTIDDPIQSRDEMLDINQRQTEFYEAHGHSLNTSTTGLPNRVWGWARGRMKEYRRTIGIKDAIREHQYSAVGDLTGKRVLDLGCYDGNSMSVHLARSAESYVGVDLSSKAIGILNEKISEFPNARGEAADFLSPDFKPEPFDLIYANSVMHHFQHFDAFLGVLSSHLKPKGQVVSFDPLETPATIRFLRWAYRPFQPDADWEWPFRKATFRAIEKQFQIDSIQGFLGRSKWPIFLSPIPGMKNIACRMGVKAAQHDAKYATKQGSALWSCMQVAMKMTRRDDLNPECEI